MDYHSLRVFLSLSNTLHYGRASRESNLSASALSRTILRLEDEVGRKLFSRDNRRVELTPAGVRFRGHAQEVLGAWEKLRDSLAEGREELSGEIMLYSSVAASATVLARLLPSFRGKYPRIHIRLETGDPDKAIERVQSGAADITVAALPGSLPRALVFKRVVVTPLLFIAPTIDCESALLTRRPPIHWQRVPMVLSEAGLSRKRADSWFRSAGVKPNVYAEVNGHEAVVSMVSLGCGVGIVPRIVLERFSREGEVRVIDVKPPLEPYIVGLCAHKRRLELPVVKAFWEIAV